MNEELPTMPIKLLIIGVIKRDDSILMRKKFAGSAPYDETWYSFGCDFISGVNPAITFAEYVRSFVGVTVAVQDHLSWDTEVKEDYDGVMKQFIYLNIECAYVSGDIVVPESLEKVEWVSLQNLENLDIVPPSIALFKKLGYLN